MELINKNELINNLAGLVGEALDKCKVYESRPQGEWVDCSEDGYVECPFCHNATNCDDNIEELHYCWNCGAELGADMRGQE